MMDEYLAASLQLKELEEQLQCVMDEKLAVSLFCEPCFDGPSHPQQDSCSESALYSSTAYDSQIRSLQDAIDILKALLARYDDFQEATRLQQEEAAFEASHRLADVVAAQESWDQQLCDHDMAFARRLSSCSSDEWEQRGNLIEQPIQLRPRPASPDQVYSDELWGQALHRSSSSPNNSSSSKSSSHSQQHRIASDVKGKRPMKDTNADIPSSGTLSNRNTSSGSGAAKQQCGICFDSYPVSSMLSAAQQHRTASSSTAQGSCGHYFCKTCMKSYVQQQLKARRYPVCCPMPACKELLSHEDIMKLLSPDAAELQVYNMLVMENSIDASLRVYCPYKDCSCLLERPEGAGGQQRGQSQDEPSECPSCHRVFCMSCGVAGWHTDMTCCDFQTLPDELRSVEDAAVLNMAANKSWKRCPAVSCGHMVERSIGCNHMRCRCGAEFCYACGTQYASSQPTANNVHGTPACSCPLFTVPEDPEYQRRPARGIPVRR